MSHGREYRPGKSSLSNGEHAATPTVAPGKTTLTQALDTGAAEAKTEPKGGATGKGGGNLAEMPARMMPSWHRPSHISVDNPNRKFSRSGERAGPSWPPWARRADAWGEGGLLHPEGY